MSSAPRRGVRGVVQVIVPSPLRQVFDYWLPDEIAPARVVPGVRVRVPFGRGTRIGVVLALAAQTRLDPERLKAIHDIVDDRPSLPPAMLELIAWVSTYYHHPIGEVATTALPGLLRRGGPAERPPERGWRATAAGRAADPESVRNAPRQMAALRALRAAPDPVSNRRLVQLGHSRDALSRLAAKGLVESVRLAPSRSPARAGAATARIALSREQTAAVESVRAGWGRFETFLLDGVTGSGKTEVYLTLITEATRRGEQVLVLTPEIGLTPQLVQRFEDSLGFEVACLHSGMGDRSRLDVWQRARDGEATVVIGTRSAVFVPLRRPGLFVVDEEHDLSFKQQDGLRYHARDIAVMRARAAGVPVVLGSATPSLESLSNAERGRYRRLRLQARPGAIRMPEVRIVDVRNQPLADGISDPVRVEVAGALERGEQALLFVNRRGYAPILMCHDCGWYAECGRCDARLVTHAALARLRCHHCGAEQALPGTCPQCAGTQLLPIGSGTERVAAALEAAFPDARIARIDRDTMRRPGALGAVLERVESGAVDVVVGTQMVAKGHHFPGLTVVGVLDCDGGLFGADFRASERMAQLIIQVSGRAGRGDRGGRVLVQTHHPHHPLLRSLIGEGYGSFARDALAERREAGLPPFTSLALLRAEAARREPVEEFLTEARGLARAMTEGATGVEVLGPAPAPMERRGGRLRAQLLLQSGSRAVLHDLLTGWLELLSGLRAARRVRWSLDVDPQEMV